MIKIFWAVPKAVWSQIERKLWWLPKILKRPLWKLKVGNRKFSITQFNDRKIG
jgi:hypothetical protein